MIRRAGAWAAPIMLAVFIATATAPAASAGLLPPIAVNDTATTPMNQKLTVAAPGVLANDVQLGGGYTAQRVAAPTHGTVVLAPDGGYVYTPAPAYVGQDTFTYRVNGGLLGLSNVATVTITITAPPPTPTPTPPPTPAPTPPPTPAPTPPPTPAPTAAATPTPTPKATVVPTPSSSPGPTALPSPSRLPGPTAVPTLSPVPSVPPSTLPSVPPGQTPAPSPTPGTIGTAASGGGGTVGGGAPSGGGGNTTGGGAPSGVGPRPATDPFQVASPSFDPVAAIGTGFDGFAWAVPGLTLAVPGLLLIIAILAQTMAAAIWLPAIRRWLWSRDRRRRGATA